MRRGEIWTAAGGPNYAGKPRWVVVVRDDAFVGTDSVTICPFTTDDTEAPMFRLPVEPNDRNGLRTPCRLMADKITTVPIAKLGDLIGRLDEIDMARLNQAIVVLPITLGAGIHNAVCNMIRLDGARIGPERLIGQARSPAFRGTARMPP